MRPGRAALAVCLLSLCVGLVTLTAGCPVSPPPLPLPAKASGGPAPVNTGETKTTFYTFDQILSTLDAWQQAYGPTGANIARVIKIGDSWEGRPIYAIKISKQADVIDTNPDILVTGGVHSCEWAAVESVMYLAKHLLEDYKKDDYVRYIVDNSEIWIVPLVNPDGFVFSHAKDDREHRLWRKNRHPLPNGEVGVDLNRAYPFKWRLEGDKPGLTTDDLGGSDDPASRNYRGAPDPADPFKPRIIEKEIQGLLNLVNNSEHRFALFLDYHSFSELFLYPYAYVRERLQKDSDTYEFLASNMANLINRNRGLLSIAGKITGDMADMGSRYAYSQASMLYLEVTTGGSIDFYYATRGIIALGIEVSPTFTLKRFTYGTGFMLDPREIVPVGAENFRSFLFAADWAIGPSCVKETVVSQNNREAFHSIQKFGEDIQVRVNSNTLTKGNATVKLVFGKPMLLPDSRRIVTENAMGLSELKLVDTEGRLHRFTGQGYWTKTNYDSDTYVGVVSIQNDATFDFTRGAVVFTATDGIGFAPDLDPATRPVYVAGEGVWLNYERDRYSRAPVNQSELTGAMEDRREPPAGGGGGGGGGRPGND